MIRNFHDLFINHVRRFINANVIAQTFAHFFNAVNSLQQRHEQGDLRLLSIGFLNVASHQDIKHLIRAAQFQIRPNGNGIIGLHQRIEKFMAPQWVVALYNVFENHPVPNIRATR